MRVSSPAPVRAPSLLACVVASRRRAQRPATRTVPGPEAAAAAPDREPPVKVARAGAEPAGPRAAARAGTGGRRRAAQRDVGERNGGGTGGAAASSGAKGTAGAAAGRGGAAREQRGRRNGGGAGSTPAVVIPGAGNCTPPAGANPADAQAAYAKFKADLVIADGAGGYLRVRRPNSASAVVNSTVSEGIAYGMLLSVYANDQPTFDKFWQYSQAHLDGNGLMNWYIGPSGETLGTGAAPTPTRTWPTPSIVADARWGGRGSLTTNYIDLAKAQIDKIWRFEVTRSTGALKPGDTGFDGAVINISYFAPAYYRAFGKVTGKTADWNRVAATSYDIIERR